MAFCNTFINFNFRLPQINFCGCFPPFMSGCFPQMPSFFNFNNSLFGFCSGSFMGFSPFMGFNNFSNFSYNNYFDNGFNQPLVSLPKYTPASIQDLWSQYKNNPSTNQNKTWVQQQNSSLTWDNYSQASKSNTWDISSNTTYSSNSYTTTFSKSVNGSVDNSYSRLSKSEAEKKAQNDPRLERLSGGQGWSLASSAFRTDIPFAKKGTSEILTKVANIIGENLVITSALGTAGTTSANTPHQIGGYKSHHNAENPKLDIDITSINHGKDLAKKLKETGYFSHISIESDHLDVQIDPSKFREEKLSVVA